jgi:DNA-binding PadR family transcriptional regulator
MAVIILAIALLIALVGLGVEIGIASWSIRRAGRHRRKESAARDIAKESMRDRDRASDRAEALDNYASRISWLLRFLYNRYNKFADLEAEVQDGLKDVSDESLAQEAKEKFEDLKKALKIIQITAKASEHIENLMDSLSSQINQIREDLRDEDEEKSESSESDKPAEAKGEDEKSPEPEAPEAEASDAESPAS